MRKSVQHILPEKAWRDENGILRLGEKSIRDLINPFGTPCYLYDSETIKKQVQELANDLNEYYPGQAEVTYAAKAYFSVEFAKRINRLGIGVDVVSLGELRTAQMAGFSAKKVHLHGNNKSEAELMFALDWGISDIVVDSISELAFLEDLAASLGKKIDIWLRITPSVETDTHHHIQTGHSTSKFGIPILDGQAKRAVELANNGAFCLLRGLHVHLGSQLFDPVVYQKSIESLSRLCKSCGFVPPLISIGGGWGVPYTATSKSNPTASWVKKVSEAIHFFCIELNCDYPKLVVEPGRYIAARAGLAIYEVGFCKKNSDGVNIVSVDGGLADNPRIALYDAKYEVLLCDRDLTGEMHPSSLVGRYCESGDMVIKEVLLPEMQRGELVAVPVSGAYQLSMSSNYNMAPRPAVLWIENDEIEVLQPRELAEQTTWWNPKNENI